MANGNAHEHVFGQDQQRPGERRTIIVVWITLAMMAVEIVAGVVFGSMALLADGLHMGSHATALGISVLAYVYARRRAGDARLSFGTGKVNALAGFAGAVLLAVFALLMAFESVGRFMRPVTISFNQAIFVAAVGLIVNVASVFILGGDGHEHHDDGHHDEREDKAHHHQHHDHNLRSAYLHVLADAFTSVVAIIALLGGKYADWVWLDPAVGVAGSFVVARWSYGLMHETARILLDWQAPILSKVRQSLEKERALRITDLHVWSIGPGIHACNITLITQKPITPDECRGLLPKELGLAHVTIEVHAA